LDPEDIVVRFGLRAEEGKLTLELLDVLVRPSELDVPRLLHRLPRPMPDRPSKTQKTPKGYEIPVPTREEVAEALETVAKGTAQPKP
jgi:hypothetical protein